MHHVLRGALKILLPQETFRFLKRFLKPLQIQDSETCLLFLDIPDNIKDPEEDIRIIIDTKGTHGEFETSKALTNSSKKKKKNESLNVSKVVEIVDIDCTG